MFANMYPWEIHTLTHSLFRSFFKSETGTRGLNWNFILFKTFSALKKSLMILNFICYFPHLNRNTFVCFFCFASIVSPANIFEHVSARKTHCFIFSVCFLLFRLLVCVFFSGVSNKRSIKLTMGAARVIRVLRELKAPRAIKTLCYLIKSTRFTFSSRFKLSLLFECFWWIPLLNVS